MYTLVDFTDMDLYLTLLFYQLPLAVGKRKNYHSTPIPETLVTYVSLEVLISTKGP